MVQRFLSVWVGIAALWFAAGLALPARAVPAFAVQDIGYGIPLGTNSAGAIVGQDSYSPGQPWVLDGGVKTPLALPPGQTSATASRIGETGTVVGQVGNAAAVWWAGPGGRTLELLPFPAGASTGFAVAVNSADQVLVSYKFPYRLVTGLVVYNTRPFLYTRAGGLLDLGARFPGITSFSDPVDLTESGRVLLQSGEIIEPVGSVTATPAFPDPPPGGYHWIALRAVRINEAGSFIGVAVLSSSMGYAQVVRWTPGTGWQVLGGLSGNVSALAIDRAGDSLMMVNWACPNAFGLAYNVPASGTYCLNDLVASGGWSFTSLSARGVMSPLGPAGSENGSIVALGYSSGAAAWRLARLTPAGELPKPPAVSLTATPHPGTWQQPYDSITLAWPSGGSLAKGYVIERRDPGSTGFVEIARLGNTYSQYDDTAITPLAAYAYRIAALGLAGMGPFSNIASATAPPAMDRTPPTVTISAPIEGATVSGSVTVSASFTDNIGLSYVSLSFSPTSASGVICTRSPAPPAKTLALSCKWDTRKVAGQSPTATVTAYGQDAIGNWVQKSVNVKVTYGKGRN